MRCAGLKPSCDVNSGDMKPRGGVTCAGVV